MKAELRVSQHVYKPEEKTVEVWVDGKFIATIYGFDGNGETGKPGVRVMSKYPSHADGPFVTYDNSKPVGIIEVTFDTTTIY